VCVPCVSEPCIEHKFVEWTWHRTQVCSSLAKHFACPPQGQKIYITPPHTHAHTYTQVVIHGQKIYNTQTDRQTDRHTHVIIYRGFFFYILQGQKDADLAAWRCPICTWECCCMKDECTLKHLHCKRYRQRIKNARGRGEIMNVRVSRNSGNSTKGRIHVDAPPLQTMPPENQERPGGGKEKFGFVTDPLL
jgi:hypothetical protein